MCAQCAATGAVVATTASAGARVWLAAKAPRWLTPAVKRGLGAVIVAGGVVAAGIAA